MLAALRRFYPLLFTLLPLVPFAAEREPRGHCRFEGRDFDVVRAVWGGEGTDDLCHEAFVALWTHAQCHGWTTDRYSDDLPEAEHGARCPSWTLDWVLAHAELKPQSSALELAEQVSEWLAREGRASDALALLDRAIEVATSTEGEWPPRRYRIGRGMPWELAGIAARIAQRNGEVARAASYAAKWHPTDTCGNCADGTNATIVLFRARLAIELGDWTGARRIILASLARDYVFDPCLAEPWIASFALLDPDEALVLLALLRRDVYVPDWRIARAHWTALHARSADELPPCEQWIGSHPEVARRWFGDPNEWALEHLDAFEIVDGKLRAPKTARYVARTGLDVVGDVIRRIHDQSSEELPTDPMPVIRGEWLIAHQRRSLALER